MAYMAIAAAFAVPVAFAEDVVMADGLLTRGSAQCILHSPVTVGIGDTIVWHNSDSARRTLVSADTTPSPFVVGMPAGGKASREFAEPGEYPYFCLLCPSLGGTMVVASETAVGMPYGPPLSGGAVEASAVSTRGGGCVWTRLAGTDVTID